MKVLVADDDPVVLSILSQLLSQAGHTVVPVADGVSACKAAETERPDLAIVDLLLPKRDGYAVLMHLRSRKATRGLPLLLLSSEPRAEHEPTALALGAQGFLPKPVQADEIHSAIRRVSQACPAEEVRR